MPIYQFWCDTCFEPYEIEMDLATKDKHDSGNLSKTEKKWLVCRECDKELTYFIAPPKTIKIN